MREYAPIKAKEPKPTSNQQAARLIQRAPISQAAPGYGHSLRSIALDREGADQGGLPGRLRQGIEALSGYSMERVAVHYDSPKPAQLQALAYTKGDDIYVGPGQERHLSHEAWHVVQQKQGRVRATLKTKNVEINDEGHLEREADQMGQRALAVPIERPDAPKERSTRSAPVQRAVIQRAFGLELQTDAVFFRDDKPITSYGLKVLDVPGFFHIESDQGELEFVTETFPETIEGKEKLLSSVAMMQRFAEGTSKLLGEGAADYNAVKALHLWSNIVTNFGIGTFDNNKDKNLSLGAEKVNDTPEFTASPQVTAGVRLEKIPEFLETMLKTPALSQPTAKDLPPQQEAIYTQPLKATADLGKTPKLQGFVALIVSYLKGADAFDGMYQSQQKREQDPDYYPKIAHPLMARNNFRAMFTLLSEQERQLFAAQFSAAKLLALAQSTKKPTDPIYQYGYRSDRGDYIYPNKMTLTPIKGTKAKPEPDHKNAVQVQNVPTVDRWIQSIYEKQPQSAEAVYAHQNKDELSHLGGQLRGRGMGQLDRMDRVASKEEHMAPVFELRQMTKSVPFGEWAKLALLAFETINKINEAKEEKAAQPKKLEPPALKAGSLQQPNLSSHYKTQSQLAMMLDPRLR